MSSFMMINLNWAKYQGRSSQVSGPPFNGMSRFWSRSMSDFLM